MDIMIFSYLKELLRIHSDCRCLFFFPQHLGYLFLTSEWEEQKLAFHSLSLSKCTQGFLMTQWPHRHSSSSSGVPMFIPCFDGHHSCLSNLALVSSLRQSYLLNPKRCCSGLGFLVKEL